MKCFCEQVKCRCLYSDSTNTSLKRCNLIQTLAGYDMFISSHSGDDFLEALDEREYYYKTILQKCEHKEQFKLWNKLRKV